MLCLNEATAPSGGVDGGDGTADLTVGQNGPVNNNNPNDQLLGAVDDLRIWNRTLSEAELDSIIAIGRP